MNEKKDLLKDIILKTVIEVLESDNKKFHLEDELYSKSGLFDSMDLVNFISLLEERIFLKFNVHVQLSNSSMFSTSRSPFKNLDSTLDFVFNLL